jgi:hypothetical protein
MMRGLSALPLDDDIVDRLLIFCPDFSTLLSTILASKSIYRVFDTHPKAGYSIALIFPNLNAGSL